ncbi:integrative and conjugative element protein, VC0181 family [Rhodococcus triatomae BKS 15-14]|nr:integrative and conjugative element protein, VC0181 family [Rhodococcus triatomae BKS 15-14]
MIADVALDAIAREALQSVDGLETGGILLGADTPGGIVIQHAGDPGPNAKRGERTFLRDLNHARELAQAAWVEDGSQWLGEWHTHPTGGLSPSDVDLHSYMRHLHDVDLGFDKFVAIIAGFDSSARVVVATWIIERDRIQSVPLRKLAAGRPEGRPTPTTHTAGQLGHKTQEHKEAP